MATHDRRGQLPGSTQVNAGLADRADRLAPKRSEPGFGALLLDIFRDLLTLVVRTVEVEHLAVYSQTPSVGNARRSPARLCLDRANLELVSASAFGGGRTAMRVPTQFHLPESLCLRWRRAQKKPALVPFSKIISPQRRPQVRRTSILRRMDENEIRSVAMTGKVGLAGRLEIAADSARGRPRRNRGAPKGLNPRALTPRE
jgi:hypothetical protein